MIVWVTFLGLDFSQPDAVEAQTGAGVRLTKMLGGLSQPVFATGAGDNSNRLFIVEKAGRIKVVDNGHLHSTPFLDITSQVLTSGFEQGLLGLAFHPSYDSNGRFFVAYTATNGEQRVIAYRVSSDRNRADPNSASTILAMPDRYPNHNGGMLAFGRDGYLYIGTGDGGGGGDPDDNGQNLGTLLGKMLRIDVNGGSPYAIPSSNPFVGRSGAKGEIWAFGLRNPWRFSFDRDNGDLYIGDVGQGDYEEIDLQSAGSDGGENYGWDKSEGAHCYPAGSSCSFSGVTQPIHEYSHSLGCSVTGGYVYRGAASPSLAGTYLFADYCQGRIWSLTKSGSSWSERALIDTSYQLSSFGEDDAGELYVLDIAGGGLYRVNDLQAPVPAPFTVGTTPTPTPITRTPTPTPTTGPGGSQPDLIVSEMSLVPATSSRGPGVSVTVKNQGTVNTGAAGGFDVHIFADQPSPPVVADNALVAHLQFATLGAGQSATVAGDYFQDALTPGSHKIWALADGHNTVTESNEGNNTASFTATITFPDATSCATGQYLAQYYNNLTLGGTPTVTRCEAAPLNYAWGDGGPGSGVSTDNFAARWAGTHSFAAGDYTFTATADDGIRVWVDGALLIDKWLDQGATTYTARQTLTAGDHQVKVEYYEKGRGAVARLSWQAATTHPPTATISTPASTLKFKVGDTITFSGSATDPEDGTIPASGLAWRVVTKHCSGGQCHDR